ncbi:hypothetical protein CDO44_09890 [Pigmentiphaga sp. NML080357]|uniref:DUF4870 family protein n=1 Tax=Pigmentiphaga sp. NML080357 TaxID=2008675 RepID=UPI000B40F46B|nr:hypothetical protein [Pigmentiphaga sp. NML080357]OVZ60391.1 hypothetical protein CDO44_09890 [Pigmentiphaga sp. NML080357]
MNEVTVDSAKLQSAKNLTAVVYALYALSIIIGISSIVAIIINYVKKGDVAGTWLESHFRWQIRTFWFAVLWGVVGALTVWAFVGWVVWFAGFIWFIYRIVKGWLNLNDGKPMYAA